MDIHFLSTFLCIQFVFKTNGFVPIIRKHLTADSWSHDDQSNNIPNELIQKKTLIFSSKQADNGKLSTKPLFIGGRPINHLALTSVSVSGTCHCPPGCQSPCTIHNGLCWSHQCGNTHYNFLEKSEYEHTSNTPVKPHIEKWAHQHDAHFNSNQERSKSFLAVASYNHNMPENFRERREFDEREQFGADLDRQMEELDNNQEDEFDYDQNGNQNYYQKEKSNYNHFVMTNDDADFNSNQERSRSFLAVASYNHNIPENFRERREFDQREQFDSAQIAELVNNQEDELDYDQGENQDYFQKEKSNHNPLMMTNEFVEYTHY